MAPSLTPLTVELILAAPRSVAAVTADSVILPKSRLEYTLGAPLINPTRVDLRWQASLRYRLVHYVPPPPPKAVSIRTAYGSFVDETNELPAASAASACAPLRT